MTATLDPIHATAQTSQTRHPLCKILSVENVPAIPFNGELLSTAAPNEQHPAARVHSTGRLVVAFAVDSGATDTLRYGYTDTERTFFTYVDFTLTSGRVCGEVAFCELADGNVGLIWEENYGGTRTIKYRKVTVVGANLTPAVTGTILTNNTADFFTGPCVERMADDSYLMVYGVMDGTHYHLYRRTSADFVTWAAAAEIDTSGLTDENRKANPALIIEAGGDLWLLFDYIESTGPNGEELTNCYYVSSTDKLATASGETALTTYADYSEIAEHPAATQKATGDIYFVFNRLMASLKLDKNTTGWTGSQSPVSNMHLNAATQKLYVISTRMGAGNKSIFCVAKIDLATWTIDKSWDTTTVPAFPSYFATTSGSWWDSYHGEGDYVPLGHTNGIISVLDGAADTITTYAFYDLSAYGIAKNVTWTPTSSWPMVLSKCWVDATTERLYVVLTQSSNVFDVSLQVGYIDLTAPGPGYAFTTVVSSYRDYIPEEIIGFNSGHGFMEVNVGAGFIIVGTEGIASNWKGTLRLYDLTTGGLWKEYTVDSNPSFPYRGLKRAVYNGGLIVGDFTYEPLYGQADYRGLCIIDTVTDIITYTRPPWASVDNYQLRDISLTNGGEYLIAAGTYGVTLFDGTVWKLFSNTTVPGLTATGTDEFLNPVVYNSATDMIIAGAGVEYGTANTGLIMFSRDGYIKQANYRIFTDGSWGTIAPLVIGYTDYDAAVAVDPDDDGLYGFWVNKSGTELSIKWDKEMPSFDLTDYLVRGTPVERFSAIDPHEGGWDAGLKFQITHGHLFDVSNDASLLRQYLTKGRKIYQQFGDRVDGTEYWETARVFTVSDDGEIVYRRGEYPVMKVEAETPRRRWDQIHIIASEYYQTTPELLIADLLTTYAGISGAFISLGTWPNSATVEYQFVDVNLADAINQVAIHFGYAIRIGAGEIVEAVKITNAGTVARSYSDNTKLLNATPRNKNSSFINRWTVRCEERTFTELLMAEELAAELNASQRWNTGKKEYRVDYTQGNKVYRNPRLEVIDSVEALAFDLAGSCSETLIDSSHDEADQSLWDTYCVIEVDTPDLTPALIASLTGIIGSWLLPDIVVAWGGGITIRTGSYMSTLFCFLALNILASTGNFQYRVYGQPVVKVRRTVQATTDDSALQVKMGQVISDQVFDDPLCESPADCQAVAEFRKLVGMGERARWSSEMVADLRNEDGDTLSVIHPSSGNAVTVYLTDLTTAYIMSQGQSEGGIVQTLEGWRV